MNLLCSSCVLECSWQKKYFGVKFWRKPIIANTDTTPIQYFFGESKCITKLIHQIEHDLKVVLKCTVFVPFVPFYNHNDQYQVWRMYHYFWYLDQYSRCYSWQSLLHLSPLLDEVGRKISEEYLNSPAPCCCFRYIETRFLAYSKKIPGASLSVGSVSPFVWIKTSRWSFRPVLWLIWTGSVPDIKGSKTDTLHRQPATPPPRWWSKGNILSNARRLISGGPRSPRQGVQSGWGETRAGVGMPGTPAAAAAAAKRQGQTHTAATQRPDQPWPMSHCHQCNVYRTVHHRLVNCSVYQVSQRNISCRNHSQRLIY